MEFLKKRWVAIVICVALVLVAIGISNGRKEAEEYHPENSGNAETWGQENYEAFTRFIYDEAGVLSEKTVQLISEQNAAMDYAHSSICALVVADGLDGADIQDAALDMAYDLNLNSDDPLLFLDLDTMDWYFDYGEEFSYYVNNELEILLRGAMPEALADPDRALPQVYEEVRQWYGENLPYADAQTEGESDAVIVFAALFVLLMVIVAISAFSAVGTRRVYRSYGPTFIVGGRRHWGHRPPPPPPPGPRPGGHNFGGSRPGGRPGGFGGSSRGRSGSRGGGGFGGSHRGGRPGR